MKQLFFKLRNIIAGIGFSAVLLTIAVPASAKIKKEEVDISALQPTVKYIGSEGNSSLFLVTLNAASPASFQLVIKDAKGEELFRQRYESSNFQKYFKMVNEGYESSLNLQFTLETIPGGNQVTYVASSSAPLDNAVTITKL